MSILAFTPDPGNMQPLYEQIYRHILQEIEAGRLSAGERLPSKRLLSNSLKVSLITIEAAYGQLLAEGYIRSAERSGYFVSELEFPDRSPAPAAIIHAGSDQPAEIETARFDLGTNQVDTTGFPFATWARLSRQTLKEDNRELLGEIHPQGLLSLRDSLVNHLYKHRGIRCDAARVVIGAGSEVLVGAIVQLLGRELCYAVESPGYAKIEKLLQGQGLAVGHVGLDSKGLSMGELRSSSADVIHITPSHQFPTGIVMPASRRLQLLTWAAEKENRYIIEDDYDSEFRFTGRPVPALQTLDQQGRVIYLGTFSKSIAPSIRISYLVLPEQLTDRYLTRLGYMSSTVSRIEQATLARFIENGHMDRHLNRMRKLYRERRDSLLHAIGRWPFGREIIISGIDSGLHLLLTLQSQPRADRLIEAARSAGIRLNGIQNGKQALIFLGYAHLAETELNAAAALLGQVWQPLIMPG